MGAGVARAALGSSLHKSFTVGDGGEADSVGELSSLVEGVVCSLAEGRETTGGTTSGEGAVALSLFSKSALETLVGHGDSGESEEDEG